MRAKRGIIRTGGGRLGSNHGGIRISLKAIGGKKKKGSKSSKAKQKLKLTGTKRQAERGEAQGASQEDVERRLAEQRRRRSRRRK
jgi:hypothetical protein